ncbi:hypothetical protein [Photobacterium leiognathi]|uniref:hypothetical protein n=1 Tax=Photobacterium leiognathi TaxID=553611 RepID=UPI002981D0AE|nr:hypothetical protein [Photobacterium leiognathi]
MINNINQKIEDHLSAQILDIRITKNARFIDQKCTPDILSSVAEAIIEYLEQSDSDEFTIKDIWMSDFSIEIMTNKFQKPSPTEKVVENEYDKVFSQPIKLLEYAGIIVNTGKIKNAKCYKVTKDDILSYLSISDDKALKFIIKYLERVLSASGLMKVFDDFFESQTKQSFDTLKDCYIKFITDNTPINGEVETSRIFTKVLNPLAFSRKKKGTIRGNISALNLPYSELFYNRVNFRDVEKPKDKSRSEYIDSLGVETTSEIYQVEKAKRQIKKYHGENSEVNRYLHENATHVHHIFMKSEYPELSDTLENLVLLTPSQHLNYAHISGNTRVVSKPYQLVCLLSKLESIEKSDLYENDDFYSKLDFIEVVNTGLGKDLLNHSMSYPDMKNKLAMEYVS